MSSLSRYLATGSKDATVIIWELDLELMQLKQSKVLEEHTYGGLAHLISVLLGVVTADHCRYRLYGLVAGQQQVGSLRARGWLRGLGMGRQLREVGGQGE